MDGKTGQGVAFGQGCAHLRVESIAGGERCRDCGALRGRYGVWRVCRHEVVKRGADIGVPAYAVCVECGATAVCMECGATWDGITLPWGPARFARALPPAEPAAASGPAPVEAAAAPDRRECGTCRWCDERREAVREVTTWIDPARVCRRMPPVSVEGGKFGLPRMGWPSVRPDDWCGEWVAKVAGGAVP